MLTVKQISSFKAKDKPYRVSDGKSITILTGSISKLTFFLNIIQYLEEVDISVIKQQVFD